jgi:hypothetical protein
MRHAELRLRSGAPTKVSPIRAGRARVAWLVLLCALLVSGGAPPSEPHPTAARSAGPLVFTEARVSQVLYRLNSGLGAPQRERIAAAVVRYSNKYELDPALVLAVISRESTARPWVRSAKGAVGLMQVMPYMQGPLLVAGNLTHVESNIEAGCMILADNIRRLGEQRGISSYFWGSEIRGVSYLRQVQEARAAVGRDAES